MDYPLDVTFKLIAIAPLYDVSSNFAMEQVKYSTEVPV